MSIDTVGVPAWGLLPRDDPLLWVGCGGRGRLGELGMAAEVVLRLCEDIKGKNHKGFFDNL